MFAGKKVVVVMPAYNAAQTLIKTYEEVIAQGIVDRVIVVDDASRDETMDIARTLPDASVHRHPENRGYGANQKTCYRIGARRGSRYRHHGPPRLPVYPEADPGHGISHRQRAL